MRRMAIRWVAFKARFVWLAFRRSVGDVDKDVEEQEEYAKEGKEVEQARPLLRGLGIVEVVDIELDCVPTPSSGAEVFAVRGY